MPMKKISKLSAIFIAVSMVAGVMGCSQQESVKNQNTEITEAKQDVKENTKENAKENEKMSEAKQSAEALCFLLFVLIRRFR